MAVNKIKGLKPDTQVFEYTDTLSLRIPEAQRHLKVGDPVLINKDSAVAGVLMSDIAPAAPSTEPVENPFAQPTYGLNGPNHASVRIKGGVFELPVKLSGQQAEVGDPVYLKASTGVGNQPVLSFDKTGADVVFGWAKEEAGSTATNSVVKVQVVLATGSIKA